MRGLCRLLSIYLFLMIVSLHAPNHSAGAPENERPVPTLRARALTDGTLRFDNHTLDAMFGDSRKYRADRQGPAGVEVAGQSAGETNASTPSAPPRATSVIRKNTPRSRVALRFAERGRSLLKAGDYENALLKLEKALALDSNPSIYYDLAWAHHHLAQYRESSGFVDAAQPLVEQPKMAAELARLKSENGRALAKRSAARLAGHNESKPQARPQGHSFNDGNVSMVYLAGATLALALLWLLVNALRKTGPSFSPQ